MSIVNCLPAVKPPVTAPLSVTENGTYAPASGVDGFSSVTVNVLSEPTFGGNFASSGGPRLVGGHVATGFSAANGFYYPKTPGDTLPSYDMTRPFHLHMKVKCSELMSRSQAFIGDSLSYYMRPSIEFAAQSASALMQAGFSTTGTAWDVQLSVSKSEMPFVANQWYTVDYTWADGTFTFSVSNGTDTITKTVSIAHFTTDAESTGSRIMIGSVWSKLYAQNVSVDLLHTYWEENGVLIWGNHS